MSFSKSKQQSQNQSTQTSESSNQAYPFLQTALSGQVSNANQGSTALASLLGLNGDPAAGEAFQKFKDSSSYNFVRDEGVKGITGSFAAKGLLGSGSALKAISNYNSNLAGNFLNSYLANLAGLSNNGLQAGQILAGAGGVSKSQGSSFGTSSGKSGSYTFGG